MSISVYKRTGQGIYQSLIELELAVEREDSAEAKQRLDC